MEGLRQKLIEFIINKFSNIENIDEFAEDIVNQAFINCRTSKNYKKENENFGYLSQICKNLAIKKYKLFKWELANLINYEDLDEDLDEILVDDRYNQNNLYRDFIKNSFKRLKSIEEKILYLKYYGDLTFAEISEKTDIKINTILSHHRRALNKLKPYFILAFGIGGEKMKQIYGDLANVINKTVNNLYIENDEIKLEDSQINGEKVSYEVFQAICERIKFNAYLNGERSKLGAKSQIMLKIGEKRKNFDVLITNSGGLYLKIQK